MVIKTFTCCADINGSCTITIKAKSMEEAICKLHKGNWDSCELNDWEISSFSEDDLEEEE